MSRGKSTNKVKAWQFTSYMSWHDRLYGRKESDRQYGNIPSSKNKGEGWEGARGTDLSQYPFQLRAFEVKIENYWGGGGVGMFHYDHFVSEISMISRWVLDVHIKNRWKTSKEMMPGCDTLEKEAFPVSRSKSCYCVCNIWSQYFKGEIGESSEKSNK